MTDQVDKYILQKYEIIQRLARGAYGIVWKAIHRKKSYLVAIKKVYGAFTNSTDAQRTYREIVIQTQLKHENIVKVISFYRAGNDQDIYVIFNYTEADLHRFSRR
jgi:mitogen-activated protein kinase 15